MQNLVMMVMMMMMVVMAMMVMMMMMVVMAMMVMMMMMVMMRRRISRFLGQGLPKNISCFQEVQQILEEEDWRWQQPGPCCGSCCWEVQSDCDDCLSPTI